MSTNIPRTSATGRTHRDGRSIRVLHVDDDSAFAELTAEFLPLENDRIVVRSVQDGDSALVALATDSVDCVVSDYEMPGMDGLAFLKRVRERWPDLPFVLFTGKGSEEVAADAISAGVSDYLQKGGTDRYALLAARLTTLVEKYWTEQELACVRRRYALVGTVAADAFFEWDVRTDTVWRSDGYARVFGYDDDAVEDSYEWWIDRLHPEDRDRVRAHLDLTLCAGESRYDDRFRFRLGDGSYAHVSARAYVEYDDGDPVTVTGALTDLTDYVEQERELKKAHARLELALEGTKTGVWEWDIRTGEVVWDGTTRRLFGIGSGAFEGTKDAYAQYVHPDDLPTVEAAIERSIETGEMYEIEHRLRPDADGTVRWMSGRGIVIFRDDDPVRMIGVVRDVSERRWKEAELQRQNERLQEFASVVSHDLKSPLAVATGHLDLVDPADDVSTASLETVSRAHDRMGRLLDDLLTLSRQGETIDRCYPVSLVEAAEDAWSMVETEGATLTVVDDATVLADEGRLGQLFENLFRNAVEHGSTSSRPRADDAVEHGPTSRRSQPDDAVEHDPPPISVTVGLLSDTSGEPGFFVADDGFGIPEADREAVFDPGHTTSTAGTGFGLAIVHRIVAAHGWAVSVGESDDGGARFEFTGVTVDFDGDGP